jgi:ADP-heptose:LPS heptosyltransferase
MTKRPTAFFINGGAGRVICSVPALETYAEENPDEKFLIICEGGTDFFKAHPKLHSRTYDNWHKNLFHDRLVDMDIVTPEPYRVWEYYNQKCSLSQAFDIEINNKGIRELPRPTLKLTQDEITTGKVGIKDVLLKTGKTKSIVFQPFGRGVTMKGDIVTDPSGRSFEIGNVVSIINKLQKEFAVIVMSELPLNFQTLGCKDLVATPSNIPLRQWAGLIKSADVILSCDSVAQHIAYALDKPAVVVTGSTFPINVSYVNCEKIKILDMGEGVRIYSPIRIAPDEYADMNNDGIMAMNDKVESVIADSVQEMYNKFVNKKD